jgi:hypothetical protein
MVSAALNDEPITAYVDAVMVPSKPERKTLQKMAVAVSESSIAQGRGARAGLDPDEACPEGFGRPWFFNRPFLLVEAWREEWSDFLLCGVCTVYPLRTTWWVGFMCHD